MLNAKSFPIELILSICILFFITANGENSNIAHLNNSIMSEDDSEIKSDSSNIKFDFPQIDIIGNKPSLFNTIPGSASLIQNQILNNIRTISGNEVFKKIPGLNIVDEEGLGLRSNIGIRGLDPDRSRTVLVMEDGIPIALAPYGEPEMYYTPAIDRMSKIEVLKGSGSILFGPQTIGGVINYITPDPPLDSKTTLNLRYGSGGFFSGLLNYGTSLGNTGVQLAFLHKQADNIGITSFDVNDFNAKVKFGLGESSRIVLKFSYYDETSNSTYLGLTQTMFDNEEYYTIMAPNDKLQIRRFSASLTHDYFISTSAYIRTTVFGYTTSRNWLRQDFSRSKNSSNLTGIIFGDSSITNGAVFMRNSTGNRDRQFEVFGVEPRLNQSYSLFDLQNEFVGGLRFLYEKAYEQRINGKKADATSGDLSEDEERIGYAGSAFLQNKIFFNDQFSLTPGLRVEYFEFERRIARVASKDTLLTGKSYTTSFVPGIGFNFNLNKDLTFFAGVHRGYAPPRVKDAISNSGESLELEAELSWNSEIGLRANLFSLIGIEFTAYLLDFSNQIIPISESSGGLGTGLVNGGSTIHKGLEFGVDINLDNLFAAGYNVFLDWNISYNHSKYDSDRFITIGSSRVNVKENKLPYAPEFLSSLLINLQTPFNFHINVSGSYVGKQFTDELNTINPSSDGQIGIMNSYFVLDLSVKYHLESLGSSLFISAKNLTDERYIASRRPQGIKAGIPRIVTAGLELSL